MEFRTVVTWIFGVLLAGGLWAITQNFNELLKRWGGNTLLVRILDSVLPQWPQRLSWRCLRELWWLWWIFGLTGGIALALWLTPLDVDHPTNVWGQQAGALPKTELRLQFYGGARMPTVIAAENVYYWYAQFSPSIGIKFTDDAGNVITPPEGAPHYDPTWNIFVVFKEPAAFKQIVPTFSNPELLGPTEIFAQTDRSFIFHSMMGIPAGELVISGQP
jgi:hypothetical protein